MEQHQARMGDFNDPFMCHQCHENDKGRVVRCQTCHMKSYCIPCLRSWYPRIAEEDIAQKCPFCRNTCSCTTCLFLRTKMNPHIYPYFSKYIPHLDPSSIPTSSSSVTPKPRMMLERCQNEFKMRKLNDVIEEDNIRYAQENNRVSDSEAGLVYHRTDPTNEEESQRMNVKSQLYKLCGVRHWKPPVYECSNDEGPSHMRLFTVKVTIEIKADSRITVLECFGDPQHKKKIAAERAAVAALWYLKNVGHTLQTDKASGR